MNQIKTDGRTVPVEEQLDAEVLSFRAQFDERSPLDELVHEGARRMLQSAIDAEVESLDSAMCERILQIPAVLEFRDQLIQGGFREIDVSNVEGQRGALVCAIRNAGGKNLR